MEKAKSYDLFLTHAWRFHDDWMRFSELMDNIPGVVWRNFSLPWHDPAMTPDTEAGSRFIHNFLESQIIPVQGVILLAGVYEVKSTRRWLDMEIEIARKRNIPIIGIPAIGKETMPEEVSSLCDATGEWDGTKIIATLDDFRVRLYP